MPSVFHKNSHIKFYRQIIHHKIHLASIFMKINIYCPTCGKKLKWDKHNPYRPFCSERCKLIDLGEWASESHRIPGESVPPKDEDEQS